MGDVANLTSREAIEKIREITRNQSCHFGTYTGPYHQITRPMYTQGVDDDGTLWFFSGKDSNKNQQLKSQDVVKLLYVNTGEDAYLSISGRAKEVYDKAKIDELWTDWAKAWFPDGKDDPNLTLLKVTPTESHYWDSKHGKVVSWAKIFMSALTGAQKDDGIEGDIRV